MSAFSNTPVTPEDDEEISSYVAKLVETKGETWKDPEVIAKGKIESDRFIEELKRQNEQLRAEVKREEDLKELIAAIKAQNKAPSVEEGRTAPTEEESLHTGHSQSPDDMKTLVEQMLAERESKTTRQQNINAVDAELSKRYGSSAGQVVARAAKELDMTVEEAEELAATKPKAFFRLMGLDSDNRRDAGVVGNALNSAASGVKSNARNNEYYKKLKKEMGNSKFFSPKIQRQLAEDRIALGDAFWA